MLQYSFCRITRDSFSISLIATSYNRTFIIMYPLWLALLPLGLTAYGQRANNSQSLLWGPYRPNLYFGLRPRIPQSLLTGLMWFGTQNYQSISRVRHACDQMDELDSYSWTEYDAREGGVQILKDSQNNVKLTTEFLKVAGGGHGGSWAARIKGEALDSGMYRPGGC